LTILFTFGKYVNFQSIKIAHFILQEISLECTLKIVNGQSEACGLLGAQSKQE